MNTKTGSQQSASEEGPERCNLLITIANAAGEAGQLRELVLAPDGRVESLSGDFVIDEEAARLIIEAFQHHGSSIVIDYHHQSDGGDYRSPDGRAPAAGWVEVLSYVAGRGLIGKVKWNEAARAAILADEYRYLSPTLWVRKSDRKAVRLSSVALTNQPAIVGMERVAASEVNPKKETETMADEPAVGADPSTFLARIAEALGVDETGNAAEMYQAILERVRELKGKGADEGEGEGGTEDVASDIRAALKLSDKADLTTVVAAIESLRRVNGTVATLQKQLNDLQGNLAERDANDLLRPYIEKGILHREGSEDDKNRYERFANMARKAPDDCRAILNEYVAAVPGEGQTSAPEGAGPKANDRAGIIVDEVRVYNSVEHHLTDLVTSVDQRLRDAKMQTLSEEESEKLAVA